MFINNCTDLILFMIIKQIFPDYIIKDIPEIDSTNRYTEELLDDKLLPEGSLVFTRKQTRGIGQADNTWESEPHKNLTVTLVLYPSFLEVSDQFLLTVVVSLSVADVVNSLVNDEATRIKWPNDIYYNHRKIAGILIKNHIMGNTISASIAGVGLNINQSVFHNAPLATSLKLLTGKEFSMDEVLSKWHDRVAYYYSELKSGHHNLLDEYLSRLYLKDTPVDYMIHQQHVTASIKGVDQYGQLVLWDASGKKYTCGLKDIVYPRFG